MQIPPRCQSLLTSHTLSRYCKKTTTQKPHREAYLRSAFCDAWISGFSFLYGSRPEQWNTLLSFFFLLSARLHRRPTRMVEMTRERLARESVMFIPFRFGTSVMLRPPDALHFPTCGKGKVCSRVSGACLWAATPAHTRTHKYTHTQFSTPQPTDRPTNRLPH